METAWSAIVYYHENYGTWGVKWAMCIILLLFVLDFISIMMGKNSETKMDLYEYIGLGLVIGYTWPVFLPVYAFILKPCLIDKK